MTTSSAESMTNGTISASRIPRSSSSTVHDRKGAVSPARGGDETISPVARKSRTGTRSPKPP